MSKNLLIFLVASLAIFFQFSDLFAADTDSAALISSSRETAAAVSGEVKLDPAKAAAELKRIFQDMISDYKAGNKDKVKAAIEGLKLSNHEKWFAERFDEAKVKGLTAEYDEMLASFEQEFGKLLEKVVKGDEREALVYMIAPDGVMDKATGLQKDAIAAMKNPCPLFTVKLVKPGETSGISVWSLIIQDGTFRFIGKLRKLQ